MNIQWYPGHMTKARRAMQEDIRLVDLVIELIDARAPLASRNPDIDALAGNKARLILLNKADLADEKETRAFSAYFSDRGFQTLALDARNRAGLKPFLAAAQSACGKKRERDARRGIMNRPLRAMVVGIPNVGKSTFINSAVGRASAKTGNRPGVTKGNQWIRLGRNMELLDTPGILWPKFEDPKVGERLAMIGSVRDEILNQDELSLALISYLRTAYPGFIAARYQIKEEGRPTDCLMAVAKSRGCLLKGGGIDCGKASGILLDDFRSGRLGRITLETVPERADPAGA